MVSPGLLKPTSESAAGESQKESEATTTFSLEIAPMLRLIGRHLGFHLTLSPRNSWAVPGAA